MTDEISASIISKQLRKARKSLDLADTEVAERLNISLSNLRDWENGNSKPPLETIWQLAEYYQRSTDYFLKHTSALPLEISYRAVQKIPISDMPYSVHGVFVRFEELCRAEFELEQALGKKREILFHRISNKSADELANYERKRMGLNGKPIRDLRKTISRQGVRIFFLPIPDASPLEVSGMSYWHKEYGPCILINSHNNSGRRSFTLAHEYAHLLCADEPLVCAYMPNTNEERFANRFAISLLLPDSAVKEYFSMVIGGVMSNFSDRTLGTIAIYFGTSLEATGRRLEELGCIPKGTTDKRIEEWERNKPHYRGSKGPRWKRQLGKEFIDLAIEGYKTGHLSATKISKYFGVDLLTAMYFISESGKFSKNR